MIDPLFTTADMLAFGSLSLVAGGIAGFIACFTAIWKADRR